MCLSLCVYVSAAKNNHLVGLQLGLEEAGVSRIKGSGQWEAMGWSHWEHTNRAGCRGGLGLLHCSVMEDTVVGEGRQQWHKFLIVYLFQLNDRARKTIFKGIINMEF